MRSAIRSSAFTLISLAMLGAGCSPKDRPDREPPPRVDVPPRPWEPPVREREEVKPLPERDYSSDVPPPPFDDVPLVNQRPPEQKAYLDAYEAVGRPRIVVFVNRTLEGQLVPVNDQGPLVSVERRRSTRGDVSVERRDYRNRDSYYRGRDDREQVDRFESKGPGEYHESTEVFLRPGEYDEVSARGIDYETMENILIDWLAADGRVEVISPVMARQRLTDQQVKELQDGRPQAMSEVARQLDTDVLVQIQARPTRQTPQGLAVRVIAEAINVRGGQSIGRGVVEVPPPLDKPQLNKYTRFLARRLMDGMTGSWRALASDRSRERELDCDAQRMRDRERLPSDANPPARDDRQMRPVDDRPRDDRQPDDRRADPRRDAIAPAPNTRPSSGPEAPPPDAPRPDAPRPDAPRPDARDGGNGDRPSDQK